MNKNREIELQSGWPVAGPVSIDQEEIIYADPDWPSPGRSADWKEFNRRESTSIVIAEQNVPMVLALAHQCIVLANGEVVASGTTSELKASDAVSRHLAL